jgi:UrcA family protein
MFKASMIALALTASLCAGGGGFAGERSGAWQVGGDSYHLYVSDLDLRSAAGRAAALARVETIAQRLCRNVGVRSEERACVTKIVDNATGSLAPVIAQARAERTRGTGVELAQGR